MQARALSLPRRSISYEAGFWKGAAYVGLRIQTDDNARTKHIFDELHADRARIEAELGDAGDARWTWHRHDRCTYLSINLGRDGRGPRPA